MLYFKKMKKEHLRQVLHWRTLPEVTRFMYTDIEPSIEEQAAWFNRVSQDTRQKYWIVCLNDEEIGLVSLNDIDNTHSRCSWAYYIGEAKHRLVGGMLAPYLYNYAFHQLGLNKVSGEVMSGNENVRKMHLLQGCREVGVLKRHIYKYGEYHDVFMYEMLKEEWTLLSDRYGHCIAEFEE